MVDSPTVFADVFIIVFSLTTVATSFFTAYVNLMRHIDVGLANTTAGCHIGCAVLVG